MNLLSKASGFALIVDQQWVVKKILFDDLGICQPRPSRPPSGVDHLFIHLIDRSSLTKAFSMLATLQKRGVVFDWEINVPLGAEIVEMHFAGGAIGDKYLIVAAFSSKGCDRVIRRDGTDQ